MRARAGATVLFVWLAAAAPGGVAESAPNGAPARIQTIGSWKTHDPVEPSAGAEPWTPADVAGFMQIYPTAFVELGIRDGQPPGTRYWTKQGELVGQLKEQLAQRAVHDPGRLCVTERPDVILKLVREEGCDPSQGGGGCDWEGDMDGSFGEQERIVKYAGVASGGDEDGLAQAGARWEAALWRHRLVVLRPGGPGEERRRVVASGASHLRVSPAWTLPPRAGDRYEIRGSFDPSWVKRVPRTAHAAAVRDYWVARRNICGKDFTSPCRPAAESLDPFNAANRRSWPAWIDRNAITSLATPGVVPVLYGPVADAARGEDPRQPWTDPFFRVSAVVTDVSDPAYRDWRIRYLMYKLRDHGLPPGSPACLSLTYKPGWYTYYDEEARGPASDVCSLPGSGLWTGPAHVCRDGSAPGGPLVSRLYEPGGFERALNGYVRELIARLAEYGWTDLRILMVERPSFTNAKWEILDEDVRRHPAVVGEWAGAIDPPLAELRNLPVSRPRASPSAADSAPPAPGGATPQPPGGGGASQPPSSPSWSEAPRSSGTIQRRSGGTGGVVEPPAAGRR